jgi:AcrR family transcriptional regulator
MARKPGGASKKGSRKAPPPKPRARKRPRDPRKRILTAALDLAAARGWRDLPLSAIAAEAGVGLALMLETFPSKSALVRGLLADTDARVLAGAEADAGASVRDRLFDVLMRRFDALAPNKDGVAAIVRDTALDLAFAVCVGPRLMGSMGWMLEAADVPSGGVAGLIRCKGLALIYFSALRVWLDDDTPDMAPTMAALDRGLARAECLMGQFCPGANTSEH